MSFVYKLSSKSVEKNASYFLPSDCYWCSTLPSSLPLQSDCKLAPGCPVDAGISRLNQVFNAVPQQLSFSFAVSKLLEEILSQHGQSSPALSGANALRSRAMARLQAGAAPSHPLGAVQLHSAV